MLQNMREAVSEVFTAKTFASSYLQWQEWQISRYRSKWRLNYGVVAWHHSHPRPVRLAQRIQAVRTVPDRVSDGWGRGKHHSGPGKPDQQMLLQIHTVSPCEICLNPLLSPSHVVERGHISGRDRSNEIRNPRFISRLSRSIMYHFLSPSQGLKPWLMQKLEDFAYGEKKWRVQNEFPENFNAISQKIRTLANKMRRDL